MVGQEILAQKLPQYLYDEYGADFTKVTEAVKAARFDWNDFQKSDYWTFKNSRLLLMEIEARRKVLFTLAR
jgi:hypothetical protein